MAQQVKNPPAMQETWVRSLGWEDPLETHSVPQGWTQGLLPEMGRALGSAGLPSILDSLSLCSSWLLLPTFESWHGFYYRSRSLQMLLCLNPVSKALILQRLEMVYHD